MQINAIQPATFYADNPSLSRKRSSLDKSSNSHDNSDPSAKTPGQNQKDQAKQAEINKLQSVDREVRAHEAAHLAAAAGLGASGPSFQYERGPDGKMYAVGGEVHINTSGAATPEETLAKARQIRAAALAPSQPSSQDMAVANQAGQMEAQALQEMRSRNKTSSTSIHHRSSYLPGRDKEPQLLSAWA